MHSQLHCHTKVSSITTACPVPLYKTSSFLLAGQHRTSKAAISGSNHSLPLHFHDKKYLCFCLFKLQFEKIQLYVIKECSSLEWVLSLDN